MTPAPIGGQQVPFGTVEAHGGGTDSPAEDGPASGAIVEYVWFSVGFVVIHVGAYIVAGVLSLASSRDLYTGEESLLAPLLRDLSEESERRRQGLLLWPAQVTRGLIMSVVLYPVLPASEQLAFGWRTAFFTGLMFVCADLAAATPFANTIEGWSTCGPASSAGMPPSGSGPRRSSTVCSSACSRAGCSSGGKRAGGRDARVSLR